MKELVIVTEPNGNVLYSGLPKKLEDIVPSDIKEIILYSVSIEWKSNNKKRLLFWRFGWRKPG